jgi:hypothetical protein
MTEIIHKDKSQRHEFVAHGILKQIPAKAVRISDIDNDTHVKMRFRRPATMAVLPDTWESSCEVSETFVVVRAC